MKIVNYDMYDGSTFFCSRRAILLHENNKKALLFVPTKVKYDCISDIEYSFITLASKSKNKINTYNDRKYQSEADFINTENMKQLSNIIKTFNLSDILDKFYMLDVFK